MQLVFVWVCGCKKETEIDVERKGIQRVVDEGDVTTVGTGVDSAGNTDTRTPAKDRTREHL